MPLDGKTITDDTRIRASVPTLKHLIENGACVRPHAIRPFDLWRLSRGERVTMIEMKARVREAHVCAGGGSVRE